MLTQVNFASLGKGDHKSITRLHQSHFLNSHAPSISKCEVVTRAARSVVAPRAAAALFGASRAVARLIVAPSERHTATLNVNIT